MANSTLSGIATPAALREGQVVAGRFAIKSAATTFGPLVVYSAKDSKTQKDVSVWAAPQGLVRPDLSAAVRNAVRIVSAMKSPDSLSVFGLSVDPATGVLLVATETLPPRSAADVVAERVAEGKTHTLVEAHQILGPVLDALTAAHGQNLAHGALGPSTVRVLDDGKGKLAGLGLGPLIYASKDLHDSFVAPEVRKGLAATARSDIYSLGAMLYWLCTGKHFDPETPATSLVSSLPITFDVIVENSTAEAPDDRFKSITSLRAALAALIAPPENTAARPAPPPSPPANAAEEEGVDVAVDVDPVQHADLGIDVDIDTSGLHAAPVGIAPAPFDGARPSMVSVPSGGATDLKGLVSEATANDAPRWMFVRNGLDHGPLTARELIQAIVREEVHDDDVVFNMDSGERKKLYEWPQYREFADQTREKRKRRQHESEVKSAIAEDTVNARAKVLVGVASMAAAAILFAVYWKTLGPGSASRRTAELDIPRPNARAVGGSIEVLPPPSPDAVRRARSGGGGGGFTTYEAAMSAPIEFNMAGGGGGGGTLQDREIVGPLNASLGRFAGCAALGAPANVQMRIAVGGAGSPIGVSVVNGSPAFKGCVVGVVRSLRWRAFGGPRVGFSWGFSVQ
jgi:serine/threonine protein kinase